MQQIKRLILLHLFLIRLQEPKKDLIARVVRIIGNKKAIELLMETAEVEQNGGLFIMVRLIKCPCLLIVGSLIYGLKPVCFRLLKTFIRGTLLPPSDAYVRSFLYLLYTLIKLYYTHTHIQKTFINNEN